MNNVYSMHQAYAIRSKYTTHFYGFHRETDSMSVTKVAYFNSKRDAEKFATFLSKSTTKTPQLYEYEDDGGESKQYKEYSIYSLPVTPFRTMLGMCNLGYHECIIQNNTVICIDSGIVDVPLDTKIHVIERGLRRVDLSH